jgi:hypothetical protein
LKLSGAGIALFLDCHNRLCHLVGDLLPYGTTLRVSVMMLDAMPAEDLVSLLDHDELASFTGSQIRFVGTSPRLAAVTAGLVDRAASKGVLAKAPTTWLLFNAALSRMRLADNAAILRVYEELAANGTPIPPQAQLASLRLCE